MKYLLTGSEMANADRLTSEKIGIPSIVLMERAALAVTDEITARFDAGAGVTVLAGPGNNGADGLAVGRLLIDRGYRVQFLLLSPKDPPEGSSAMTQRKILEAYGETPEVFSEEKMRAFGPEVIVDALFGTGLGRALSGTAAEITEAVNRYRSDTKCTVVGLDLPSGISSEDGSVMGCVIKCDLTVTFAYYKRGHFMYPGCSYCGDTVLRQIGIHDRSFTCDGGLLPEMIMPERGDFARILSDRDGGGNKGTFGKILIAAGSYAMCGAALLSAEACMRSGAGMVKLFTREENRVIIQKNLPEAMLTVYGALSESSISADQDAIREKLRGDLRWADAVAVGPGIGRGEEARLILMTILEEASKESTDLKALVLDADALRLIASDPEPERMLQERNGRTACILTPHLAEFADLAHVKVAEAKADRISLMRDLAAKYRCTVIGKDARTLIVSDGIRQISMITNGNSGMATAGSGDVLTGITSAMLFAASDEEGSAHRAAEAAAFIHAEAGRLCKESLGEQAMLAGDLIRALSAVFKSLKRDYSIFAMRNLLNREVQRVMGYSEESSCRTADSEGYDRVWAQIDMDAVLCNMDSMRANIKEDTRIVAVLKTNAYGHGAVAIMRELENVPYVWGYATATFEEAKELRENGAKKPILLLGYVFPRCYRKLVRLEIRPACFREDMLEELSEAAQAEGKPVRIHLALDTGMGRIGIMPDDEGLAFVRKAMDTPGIIIEGMFTHFAKADEEDHGPTYKQIALYTGFRDRIKKELGFEIPLCHCSNSAGIIEFPEANMNLVRAGITLYGLWPSDEVSRTIVPLKPLMTLYSRIVYIKEVGPGISVSYGGTYTTTADRTRIATVPVGYGDGYPRSLSNKGYVLICGKRAPILGRVCMDQMMVDVTQIPQAQEGSLCTLIGKDGAESITMEQLGDLSGRFNYELACDINARVPRVVIGGTLG